MGRASRINGKPSTELPSIIPSVKFLSGDFGKAVYEEYEGRRKADYRDCGAFNVLSFGDGLVRGSNPFAVVLINQIVGNDGLRVATPAQLEAALRVNALNLRGGYEDSGLAIRSQDNPNSYLAEDLLAQVRARGLKEIPVMIPLAGLALVRDSRSECGVRFRLTDDATMFCAPVLNRPGNFRSEDMDVDVGLPTKIGDGDRTLYTRDSGDSGLSRLCLSGDLNLISGWDDLAGVYTDGRVVVVSDDATS